MRIPSLLLSAVFAAGAFAGDSGIDLKAIDTSVSPCQNFFQYACGTWRRNNPIPPDRARWSRFDELAERNLAIDREILEKAAPAVAKRTPNQQKLGDFYASCMDEAGIEKAGLKPIEATLARIAAIKNRADVVAELARLHKDGTRALFTFFVRPDAKNVSIQIANVDQGGLGLPDRDYYLNKDARSEALRQQYLETMRKMLGMIKTAEPLDAATVMATETRLAAASLDRVKRRNPDNTYHKFTVAALTELAPAIDWKRYFADLGLPQTVETLNVGAPDFVKALNAEVADQPLNELKAYLVWQTVLANADQLPRAFRDANFEFFSKTLRGQKEQQARWKQCTAATDRSLGDALGEEFVKKAFSGASKARALQLVDEIEKAMEQDIKTAAWMSPATKDQAFTKLKQVSNKIGYPDKWKEYSSVSIVRGEFFANTHRARDFEIKRNFAKIGKPVDKTEWVMTPPTVNAYYSPPENNINFPAGILQPPFYAATADDAVNYGAIGVVIGHELTHGFDDQGRRFDGSGNLRDWWTPADAKSFETRADCVVKEYGGFSPVEGVKLNGKLTLGENAADNGGIHLAYAALVDSMTKHMLPKMDGFTPQQRFFLGYAQIWCENSTEAASRLNAQTNPHSPGEFRVNGVIQNVSGFKDAFSCKAGDPMVSGDACRVW